MPIQRISENFLKLNDERTEVLIIGSNEQEESLASRLGSRAKEINSSVKNLGVIIDDELNLKATMLPRLPSFICEILHELEPICRWMRQKHLD